MLTNNKLKFTLEAPPIPGSIPQNSQWLAGEGAGSWFHIKEEGYLTFEITRYSAEGKPECRGQFQIKNNNALYLSKDYEFIHLSHCKSVNIRQDGSIVYMERITRMKSQSDIAKHAFYQNFPEKIRFKPTPGQ